MRRMLLIVVLCLLLPSCNGAQVVDNTYHDTYKVDDSYRYVGNTHLQNLGKCVGPDCTSFGNSKEISSCDLFVRGENKGNLEGVAFIASQLPPRYQYNPSYGERFVFGGNSYSVGYVKFNNGFSDDVELLLQDKGYAALKGESYYAIVLSRVLSDRKSQKVIYACAQALIPKDVVGTEKKELEFLQNQLVSSVQSLAD